jgi:hypothetical protein
MIAAKRGDRRRSVGHFARTISNLSPSPVLQENDTPRRDRRQGAIARRENVFCSSRRLGAFVA